MVTTFLLVTILALEHIESLSDDAPPVLAKGMSRSHGKHYFWFEFGWLHRDGFCNMVKDM